LDSARNTYPLIFSPNSPMLSVYRTLERVFDSDATVLIEGESGTGKDALAHWLHRSSSRSHAPCIKIDLGSLPDELIESELFGYERGAFTGALTSKLGKLDLAQGGSVVLDEIANVDLRIQAKLLHVVEAKEYFRLGGSAAIELNCRIIALSSIPLARAVESKTFRQDLFFRLNLITVTIPPLRERADEIPMIANMILSQLGRKYSNVMQLDRSCEAILMNYDFPGNLRELRNGLERAMLMGTTGTITPDCLPTAWLSRRTTAGSRMPSLEDLERSYIAEVLRHTHGRKIKAAAILGVSRKTLLEKRKKYGLL
jgi:transcriptional regulator with PAS, ATPase and Fis domain